ncbi:hypothetical protein DTO013E5_2121 [Penicillium roqueforti]|uniref:Genomic scaffold, ProqFM164S02 n=1 Tax=Penicillium roqueforti (strain FM164) TaxID=1365484 RepID=W6QBS6_PENRF|nr:uncharacterized protein LCP9604111_1346 [Penicillium roqueforti]CDM31604.1 unnamed protein product [Penicillium roqueforti FM164]KAF9253820.1 hypothetical protein LCP9604111_1346 [Penicillium roqueforti]KAI2687313.1 hypothetical protein LCP963914a_3914 [Penicillium roqueforti]KAI2724621.1 hypothetical protein CBS147318_1552 [Penicillium roqueforti]KAI2725511.1 hypothetical protein CBS147354_4682 [Penicillium roqueforti]
MEIDTIIVGNGPSAMILSYILHGHIPFYSSDPPHPDHLLDAKLKAAPDILNADVNALTAHFGASRLSYSTQALPVNVLLDTLVRPSVDVDEPGCISNIDWRSQPEKAVSHLVFGKSLKPGGQWTEDPWGASWDIQTLSYAAMLSLPGYSFAAHHKKTTGKDLPSYTRPTRREIADYFAAYPEAAHIDDAFRCGEELKGISRTATGFYVHSHNIHCKRLVLASGIFSEILSPEPVLRPLLETKSSPNVPLVVVGSGFSAADSIISASPDQKILHIYKWSPNDRPSPLRACHQQAYPEYAGVYRLMKRAALTAEAAGKGQRPKYRRATSTPFLESRNWEDLYEGLPNVEVTNVKVHGDLATVTFRQQDGTVFSRTVAGLVYAAGRRGTLDYLDPELRCEVLGQGNQENPVVTGQTLRAKAIEDLEVAPGVYIIGSLTGDSLVRFSYGGCVYTAGHLIDGERDSRSVCSSLTLSAKLHGSSLSVMNGMDGHHVYPNDNTLDLAREDTFSKMSTVTNQSVVRGWWKTLSRMWSHLTR